MQLSSESYRVRWLVLVAVWSIGAFSLLSQAGMVRNYLDNATSAGLRGQISIDTPLKMVYPAFGADAQTWVRHSLSLLEGDSLRLRYTTIDNAPKGREVHWNSAWAWTIAGAGWIRFHVKNEPLNLAVERATIWLTPLTLLTLTIIISTWVTRRAGLIAGVLIAATMFCKDRIYEGFFPSYVDHHGLLTISVLGLMTGGILMGGGWWHPSSVDGPVYLPTSPQQARKSAVFSALAGACGLWVTAASAIPPIAIMGIAGVATVILCGASARRAGLEFDGMAWRTWGRTGGFLSLVFWALEYFPNHIALRLEPNHPFHALAWWGAGELIAEFGERWNGPAEARFAGLKKLALPLIAVSIAPLTIIALGSSVFVVIDPFLAKLHNDYIQEFLPLWRTMRTMEAGPIFHLTVVECLPLIVGIATLSFRRGENLVVLWFATIATLMFNFLGWWQSRWLLNAAGAHAAMFIAVFAVWFVPVRLRYRWIALAATICATLLPSAIIRYTGAKSDIAIRRVSPGDAKGAVMRDIANTIRNSQPQGDIVMLASPNASTSIGYFGRFKTIGTLYWENNSGLKSAGAIFSAKEDEAARLLKEHGVTHIAIVAEENFIKEYNRLLHPNASEEEINQSFGMKLARENYVPQWLQMIPYRVPEDLRQLNLGVMLFKVSFGQSLADALYAVVLNQMENELWDAADNTLNILIERAGENHQPWLRKAEIALRRKDWQNAAQFAANGAARVTPQSRGVVLAPIAENLYHNQQHNLAAQLYRLALKEYFIPDIAAYLAWLLSTSKDDSVRNGTEALQIAEATLKVDANSPTNLHAYAAALAELGRFDDAVAASQRALANAQLRNEAASAKVAQDRIAQYREKRPIRN